MASRTITILSDQAGATVAAVLRPHFPDFSWKRIRQLVSDRQVRVGAELCLDPARRLRQGEVVEILARPVLKPRALEPIVLRFVDKHLVVVDKPAGLSTVRHPAERSWTRKRQMLSPTLENLVPPLLAQREGKTRKGPLPRLRIVQRLDKVTSGLIVFARTADAERNLGRQFRQHTVNRRYIAVIPGFLPAQTLRSFLVRDRGDGRRGSTVLRGVGKEAITHITIIERLPAHTVISCQLETGRTHQIRIHLAEAGHPICGDKVYTRTKIGTMIVDASKAPRLALHAALLGFEHPITGAAMHWEMALPEDLEKLVRRLRKSGSP